MFLTMTSRTEDGTSDPPEVDVPLLKNKNLLKRSVDWQLVQLPIYFLLLTVTDCAFLACLSYLNPGFFKSYHKTLSLVYFGDIGGDEMRQKIAVIKCDEGSDRLANLSKVSVRQSGYSMDSLLYLALFLTFKQLLIQYPLQSVNEDGSRS